MKTKFRLEFAPRFERRFKDLDQQTQIRILREVDPDRESACWKGAQGAVGRNYSFRIGAFRIVYLISQDRVVLLTVGHRKDVYE